MIRVVLKLNDRESYSFLYSEKFGSEKYSRMNVSLNQTDRYIWRLIYFLYCPEFQNKELNFMIVNSVIIYIYALEYSS